MDNPTVDPIRDKLLQAIAKSDTIRKELPFEDHVKLYHGIKHMPDATLLKLNNKLGEAEMPPPVKVDARAEKTLKMGLMAASLVVPMPGLSLAINYLVDVARYKCIQRVETSEVPNKNLAYAHCKYRAIADSIRVLTREFHKCKKMDDPKKHKKCEKKLYKLIASQRTKLTKAEGRVRIATHKAKERARKAQNVL